MRVSVVPCEGARERLGRGTVPVPVCESEDGDGGRPPREGEEARLLSETTGIAGGGKVEEGETGRDVAAACRGARA